MVKKPTITARDLAAMNRGERVKRKISSDGHTRLQVDKGKVSRAHACGPPKIGHETHLSPILQITNSFSGSRKKEDSEL